MATVGGGARLCVEGGGFGVRAWCCVCAWICVCACARCVSRLLRCARALRLCCAGVISLAEFREGVRARAQPAGAPHRRRANRRRRGVHGQKQVRAERERERDGVSLLCTLLPFYLNHIYVHTRTHTHSSSDVTIEYDEFFDSFLVADPQLAAALQRGRRAQPAAAAIAQ